MDAKLRIQTIRLIEQIEKHPKHAEGLGLENDSVFLGDGEILFGGARNVHQPSQISKGHRIGYCSSAMYHSHSSSLL